MDVQNRDFVELVKRTREKFVSTRPGSTVITRIGLPSRSSRNAYVKPRTANFDVM